MFASGTKAERRVLQIKCTLRANSTIKTLHLHAWLLELLCSRYSRMNYVRSLNLVYPADLVRRVFRLSAAGSYVTGEITATRITCSSPADTHSFSSTFFCSAFVSSYLFALCLKLNHFYPIQLTLFKRFVSSCLFLLYVASTFHCIFI